MNGILVFALNTLVLCGIVASALVAVKAKKVIDSVIALAATGSFVALEFVLLQAPDVAIAEASVGAVLSTILYIIALLAIILAILMDLSRTFKRCIFPHLVVTQTVPVMVLGPLFAIWLGFGMAPKILMVIFMCFFPIAISFTEALAQCDEEQISLLKSFGASTVQIYRMVKIPSAASALFSGLQVSATYCIGGAIVGEWLSAAAGLGYYMIRVKNGYMLDKVFACVVVIIVLSLLLNLAMKLLERIIFPHVQRRRNKE